MKTDEASSTAFTVSQGIVFSGRYAPYKKYVPIPLLESNELLLSSCRAGRKLLKQLNHPLYRLLLRIFEKLTLPGLALHYVLRKIFIEKCVREAIDMGAKQVVILGAGFDTLALRLSEQFPSVKFIEVDHPATSKEKFEALSGQVDLSSNYSFAAVDFSQQSLYDALSSDPIFNKTLYSVFVCEGVLMYLSKADVLRVLDGINLLSDKKKHLIFTALEPLDSNHNDSGWLLRLYLWFKQESLGWTCVQSHISEFLEEHHYQVVDTVGDLQIARMMMPGLLRKRFHRGEYVVNSISHSSEG